MLKVVFLQFCATIAATAIAAVFFGHAGAVSAAFGGMACVLPSGLFALRLYLVAQRGGSHHVAVFFVGEIFKVASIVGLLVLVGLLYEGVHWGALFLGLILALKANLFAFLVKT